MIRVTISFLGTIEKSSVDPDWITVELKLDKEFFQRWPGIRQILGKKYAYNPAQLEWKRTCSTYYLQTLTEKKSECDSDNYCFGMSWSNFVKGFGTLSHLDIWIDIQKR